MPATAAELRFFVDESALGLGKALERARNDVIYPGHPLSPVQTGAKDPDWMPVIASRGLAVVGRDKHIRTKPGELALLNDHGLKYFWIAGTRDLSTWQQLTLLVRRWRDIEAQLLEPGPWFIAILETRLTALSLVH